MPRKLPLYVQIERLPRNKRVRLFYFRVGKGKRTRLPDMADANFWDEYLKALSGVRPAQKRTAGIGTLEWLIRQYCATVGYQSLSPATKRQRANIFKSVVAKSGSEPFKSISRTNIVKARDKRSDTPAQARNFLDAMRGLFRWALEAEHVKVDPTANVSNPKRPKDSGGFSAWNDDDVSRYEAKWKAGTKERVWLHVLLHTGLRRGDATIFGRQHIRNGVATIRTEKTGMEVSFRISPALDETLKRGPTGDLAFIVGDNGKPLTKETFGNYFRTACTAAGVRKSAHGLRKLAATRAAEAGCSEAELEARFGWTGGTMASLYTRTARRKRLAASADDKIMGNSENTNAPSRDGDSPSAKNVV